MMHTPLFLQGVPPSQLESLKLHVQEERNCYVVQAHMPGVRQEDLDVRMDDSRTLRIAALRRERDAQGVERTAHISRNYILPKHANPDEVDARLDAEGRLTVQVLKVGEMLDRKRIRLA